MIGRTGRLVALVLLAAACSSAEEAATTTRADTTTTAPTSTVPAATATSSATSSTTIPETTTTTEPLPALQGLALEVVASGFERPTFVTAPSGDDRLFVVEAPGRVQIVTEDGTNAEPFLNIRNKVGSNGIEQGLLGLAFHPGYSDNGRFFVYYTDRNDDSVLAEYRVSDDPDRALDTEGTVLLSFDQPDIRHNAGMVAFGPDRYLYVGLGDGGAGGASKNGQHPETLLGAILRLDVDTAQPYAIPPDNPFVDGAAGAPEVWAYGLRNPWRFSIDPETRLMYIGDVGQESVEEVSVISIDESGQNLGWPILEGSGCFTQFNRTCDPAGMVQPVVEWTHDEGLSVTGGYVYRGSAIPEISGHYFYADWVSGWLRSFQLVDGQATEARDWTSELAPGQVNSFGVDGSGELYVARWDGSVARLVAVR